MKIQSKNTDEAVGKIVDGDSLSTFYGFLVCAVCNWNTEVGSKCCIDIQQHHAALLLLIHC